MKIYTEEQVKKAIDLAKVVLSDGSPYPKYIILSEIKGIELPSDEEIEERYYKELEERKEFAKKDFTGQVAGRHPDLFGHNEVHHMVRGYLEAIKWVMEQIKQQYRDQ